MFNGCNYKDEYIEIIIDRYIKTKRLITQNYSIIHDKIKLEKKQYRYIKNFNQKDYLSFNDGLDKIIVDKKNKKEIKMNLNGKELLNENGFITKNKNVKNIKDNIILLESKTKNRSQSIKSMNNKIDDNSSKATSINNRDNNTISMDKHDSLSFTSKSNKLEDSEKEIKGYRFYSKDKRYIFLDLYSKEIDGVYILYTKFLMTFIEFKKSMNTLLDLLNK